jgi:hypothetical protein
MYIGCEFPIPYRLSSSHEMWQSHSTRNSGIYISHAVGLHAHNRTYLYQSFCNTINTGEFEYYFFRGPLIIDFHRIV